MKDFLRWLSMAHNQPAILSQRVVEAAHHMLRGCWGEVDQHVAAENQSVAVENAVRQSKQFKKWKESERQLTWHT